jgi:hypothetical membrane protein
MKYSDGTSAAVFFFIAAFQFVLGLLMSEAFYPGYSVSENYISDLGIGPSAMIFNVSVFLLGVLMMVGTFFLQRAFHNKVFTVFLILNAVGSMGVGVFPENLEPMHSIAALLIFLFGGLSILYSSRLMKRPFSLIGVLLGILSYVALTLFVVQQYVGLGVGGMERLVVYPILVWAIGFSGYLCAFPEKS